MGFNRRQIIRRVVGLASAGAAYASLVGLGVLAPGVAQVARAADIVRTPSAAPLPISSAVSVPGATRLIFLSGAPPAVADPSRPGTTESQASSALGRLGVTLSGLGLGFGDIVQTTIYLAGDPAKSGQVDLAGFNNAWSRKFGTADQPNKPARTTVKVAGLVTPGALIEIDAVVAARDVGPIAASAAPDEAGPLIVSQLP